jgi:hypothetical protein
VEPLVGMIDKTLRDASVVFWLQGIWGFARLAHSGGVYRTNLVQLIILRLDWDRLRQPVLLGLMPG